MRILSVLGLVAALTLGLLLVVLRPAEPGPEQQGTSGALTAPAPVGVSSPRGSAGARDLEDRVESLELQLELALGRIAALEGRDPVRLVAPGAEGVPAVDGERSPEWYLQQYVASFRGGGTGSEFFRLAVAAHVTSLVDRLLAILLDASANPVLRERVAGILGDGRLAGHPKVVLSLVRVAADPELVALTVACAQATGAIAQVGDLAALESGWVRVRHDETRRILLDCMLQLAGEEGANALIARLMAGVDEEVRRMLLTKLVTHDPVGAEPALRTASHDELPVRRVAAARIGQFRAEQVAALIQDWIARETDEEVLRLLRGALEELATIPDWHHAQTVGPPDVANVGMDSRDAWAPAREDGGEEWLDVTFATPLRATGVRIHEVCTAGAVAKVTLYDASGTAHVVFQGTDPLSAPDVFHVAFDLTGYEVQRARITLDTSRSEGWNEIDAVELVGPGGRSWVASTNASSWFGEQVGSGMRFQTVLEGF